MSLEALCEMLDDLRKKGRPLSEILDGPLPAELIRSAAVAAALARFSDQRYIGAETSGIYRDDKFVLLGEHAGWTCSMSSNSKAATWIYTVPFPTLLCPVSAEADTELSIYDIALADPNDLVRARSLKPRLVDRIRLGAGEFWTPAVDTQTCIITRAKPGTVYLRLSGPPCSHYMHAYSVEDFTYSYTGYATDRGTEAELWSHAIKALTSDVGFIADLRPEEKSSLIQMTREVYEDETFAPVGRWSLLQMLARLEPAYAREQLVKLSAGSDPLLAPAAERALGREAPHVE